MISLARLIVAGSIIIAGCASSPEPITAGAQNALPREAYVRGLRPGGDNLLLLDTHIGWYGVHLKGACTPQLRSAAPITLDPAVGGLVPGQKVTLNDLPCEVLGVDRADPPR